MSQIQAATNSISSSLKPLVVDAGVPILRPLVINLGWGSLGTAFLFTVMLVLLKTSSAFFPVISF